MSSQVERERERETIMGVREIGRVRGGDGRLYNEEGNEEWSKEEEKAARKD